MEAPHWTPGGWWRSLEREQKFAVVILGVCGFFAVALAVTHLRANLIDPFRVSKSVLQRSQAILARQIEDERKLEESKTKDTDRDGLTDYEESSMYQTSPYLPDTDSDGVSDAEEIRRGEDPNCPKGKTCFQSVNDLPVTVTTSTFEDLLSGPSVNSAARMFGADAPSVAGAQAFIDAPPAPETMNAAQIKEYFLSHSLITQDQANQLTDEQLVQIYQAAYAEAIQVQKAYRSPTSTGFVEQAPADLFGED